MGLAFDPDQVPLMQRIITSASEKLRLTQNLIARHGFSKAGALEEQKITIYKKAHEKLDEARVAGLITDLAHLNDDLYRLISFNHFIQQYRTLTPSAQDPNHTAEISTSSLVKDLWVASDLALHGLEKSMFKSILLRRTFQRAAIRMSIWRDDFDFDLSQMEIVLGTNEYLYGATVMNFADLLLLCCMWSYPCSL